MIPFFSRVTSALLTLTLAASAQQVVCLSVHNGPATGTTSLGTPAQLAARVEGVQVGIATAPGMPAAAASAAHEAAFVAAGFTTARVNANEFCITMAPGGAPITRGSCYGTDDLGLDLDSDVHAVVPVPPGGAKTKTNGAGVPLPPVQQPPQPQGGVIVIEVWVRIGTTRVLVVIQIFLQPGLNGQALRQSIEQQLLAHGMLGNVVTVTNPLQPMTRLDLLQLERTVAGDPIDGIEFQYDAMSRRIVQNVTGAGLDPLFGAAEYGEATIGPALGRPWSRLVGQPRLNGFFDVFHHVELPNAIGGFVLGIADAALPVWNAVLLVDPTVMVIELGLTDANGTLARHWVIPGTAALLGFPLHSQGFAASGGQLAMSTGMVARLGL